MAGKITQSERAGVYRQWGSTRVFVPRDLPPDPPVFYDHELIALLSDANGALGSLRGVIRFIPNPDNFIGMYMRKEALLSSQIEGSQASLVDMLTSERKDTGAVPAEIREVLNYFVALQYGLKRVSELPFSLRLLQEIHGILLRNVRGSARNPGEFRAIQNWIGPPGVLIEEAEFIPPPVPEMKKALGRLAEVLPGGDY